MPMSAGRQKDKHSMNHSIYSADRMTHLKVVVAALVGGICITCFVISARFNADDRSYVQTARTLKAGAPVAISSSAVGVIR